jgi:GNAT superfamily N-acetyltransferase
MEHGDRPMTDIAPREWRRGEYSISTDRRRLQLDVVHGYLARSYWAAGIPRAVVERSIENSLCFGLYRSHESGEVQIGFARAVTDCATFAWVSDVFVLEEARGKALGQWLVEVMTSTPELAGLRRWVLATADAHGLYRGFGFRELAEPGRYMERLDPDVYRRR